MPDPRDVIKSRRALLDEIEATVRKINSDANLPEPLASNMVLMAKDWAGAGFDRGVLVMSEGE